MLPDFRVLLQLLEEEGAVENVLGVLVKLEGDQVVVLLAKILEKRVDLGLAVQDHGGLVPLDGRVFLGAFEDQINILDLFRDQNIVLSDQVRDRLHLEEAGSLDVVVSRNDVDGANSDEKKQ